jgi:hypothetical protein
MCANIGYSQPTGDTIAGWVMIRNRERVVTLPTAPSIGA